jgi:hypothetical protein
MKTEESGNTRKAGCSWSSFHACARSNTITPIQLHFTPSDDDSAGEGPAESEGGKRRHGIGGDEGAKADF